ncbi:MAG: YraN family protein [Pedobacter sp.]
MTRERLKLGSWGEDVATRYLRKNGMKILGRNVRSPVGEIDIVAQHGRTLVFIEVKTRRGISHGHPQEAVGAAKQRQIVRAAQWYLIEHKLDRLQPRFDVVAVRGDGDLADIVHFPGAFDIDGW